MISMLGQDAGSQKKTELVSESWSMRLSVFVSNRVVCGEYLAPNLLVGRSSALLYGASDGSQFHRFAALRRLCGRIEYAHDGHIICE
jgi:hypothetical protein